MESGAVCPSPLAAKGQSSNTACRNISETERLVSLVAGGAMLAFGLLRRFPGGLLVPLSGAALLYRGWTGHCSAYQALGINRAAEGPTIEAGEPIEAEEPATARPRPHRNGLHPH